MANKANNRNTGYNTQKSKSKFRKGNGNSRNNKSNYKGNSHDIEENHDAAKASNSVNDYVIDSNLLRNVASIPFSWATGTPINLENAILKTTSSKGNFTIPGLLRVNVQPSVGRATQASDPINVAANRIYAYVRHANSGSKNYDAPDLMIYLIAISNVYGFIMQCQRLLGVIGNYSVYNRYTPDVLIQAMGGDPNDMRANLANYRARLNMLITKAASFAVPSDMPYFKNIAETLGNYYIEGTSMKDQMYCVVCKDFYRYKLNTDASGMLELARPASSSVADLMKFGEDLLSRLIYSEDMNTMSGDILKAYGTDRIYKLATISEGYSVSPLMDVPVLEQIKNTTTVDIMDGMGNSISSLDANITQDPTHAFLVCNNVLKVESPSNADATDANARALALQTLDEKRFITTSTADVTPELVMENTKFMVGADLYSHEPGKGMATITLHSRNFVARSFTIYHGDVDGQGNVTNVGHNYSYATPVNTGDANSLKQWLHMNALRQYFKFCPITHPLGFKAGNTAPAVSFAESEIYQDVDNYAIVDDATLSAMHEAALLSLFHLVPIGQA